MPSPASNCESITDDLIAKINNGSNSTFHELYGSDDEICKEQANRYVKLINDFSISTKLEEEETKEIFLFSSPGRTEIGGNHTDHNHGFVLAGAINLDNIAVVRKNNDNIIRIKSVGYDQYNIDITDDSLEGGPDPRDFYTSKSIVKGIAVRLKQLNYNIGGFDACIDGHVPKGSGLSSSASFEVLVVTILNHLYNNGFITPVDVAIISQWSENVYFGKPCGLMDQTACSVGGLVCIDFKNPTLPIVRPVNFDFASQASDYALIITNVGGGGHDDPKSQEEYASLPNDMKSVAKEVVSTERKDDNDSVVLRDTTLDDVIKDLSTLRKITGDRAILRSYHYFKDNERVLKQVNALESNNFEQFLDLVIESGQSSFMFLQNIYDITHAKKEQEVSIGLMLSEIILKQSDGDSVSGACRVHGGGFGGTIQAFVPKNLVKEYITTLESTFGKNSCYELFIRSKGSVKLDL